MASPAAERGLPVDAGLGTSWLTVDPQWGPVEVLDLMPALSTPASESAIRAAAAAQRQAGIARDGGTVAVVHDVRRGPGTLSVVSAHGGGIRLLELLDALETGRLAFVDQTVLDLAGTIARAVGWLHDRPGAVAHGLIAPAHIMLGRDGDIVLTHAVFAEAVQALEWSRDRWWRQCGLALPPSASAPRFDQRADVVELGAVVLAVLLRRRLAPGEYGALPELVMEAAAAYEPQGSGLRAWLQQALHLHPRATFASAVEASAQLSLVLAEGASGRPSLRFRTVIRGICRTSGSLCPEFR